MKYGWIILVLMGILIAGCGQNDPLTGYCADNEKAIVICEPMADIIEFEEEITLNESQIIVIDNIEEETSDNTTEEMIEETPEEVIKEDIEYSLEKSYSEGDLIDFGGITVVDPDGDEISLVFSEPLNEDGVWQTETGNAGEYTIVAKASDGISEIEEYIKLIIVKKNNAPTLTIADEITAMEGESVNIEVSAEDEEGDEIAVTFSGWITSENYTTTYDDAGEYTVTVTASDGVNEVSKDISIIIANVNRAPVLQEPTYDIIALEGEIIELDIVASDADGDEVSVDYGTPFNSEGSWVTEKGNVGEYTVTVTASDGTDSSSIEVIIIVEAINAAPVIEEISNIEVYEGDTVKIEVVTSDNDGDDVTVSFSGWMTTAEYITTYDDAGEYTVTVSATDNIATVTKNVSITVLNVNRPPIFVW